MKKATLYKLIDSLDDIRRRSAMETAWFVNNRATAGLGLSNENLNIAIKAGTEGWRDAWIIAPLEAAIAELQSELDRKYRIPR